MHQNQKNGLKMEVIMRSNWGKFSSPNLKKWKKEDPFYLKIGSYFL